MYEHLDITPLISWKAWSPNRIDLNDTTRPFIFWIVITFGLDDCLDRTYTIKCICSRFGDGNKIDVLVLSDTTVCRSF